MLSSILLSSESNEWYTPAKYIEAARLVLGCIDLDPASNYLVNKMIDASDYYTIETNGLDKMWHGRVWLNPPYGKSETGVSNQEVWSAKLISEYQSGRVRAAILLVNASTDCKWFQPLWDYPICFTDHRIKFDCPGPVKSQPTKGNAFVYFGVKVPAFAEVFRQFGPIVGRLA